MEQLKPDGKYQWMVVLPGMGCNGCIQEGEYFMKDHIEDERILFVLTQTSSLKILQQKTDVRIDEHSNIFLDKDNLFQIPTTNAIYPCVIEIKDGTVFKFYFQNPSNDAFRQLKTLL